MSRFGARSRGFVAVAAAAATTLCGLIALGPFLAESGVAAAAWMRLALAPACHQLPDRCLDIGAGPMPVCARCFGLYAGGALGLLVSAAAGRSLRPRLRWLLLAALPSVIDFTLGKLGWPTLANLPRMLAALVPGLLVGLLLADAVASLGSAKNDESPGSAIT